MTAIIRAARVRELLTPWLGARLAEETPLAEQAAGVLRGYIPRHTALGDVARQLETVLFRGLYATLGRSMTLRLGSGETRRIRMDDLPDLADDVLLALMETLSPDAVTYGLLREYAVESGSRSALRVLYTRYAAFQSPEELAMMGRVLRGRYPACPDWLKLPE